MNHTIIIAEAGVNHNGSLEMAKQMILVAKEAGVDYVKFQTAKPELGISRFAEMATYQKKNLNKEESQLDMVKKICLPMANYKVLKDYCDEVEVKFLSTPFDAPSVDLLMELGVDYMKIPSGELTNLPYLRKVAEQGRPVIMSTGMCEINEVEDALNVLLQKGLPLDMITLLHCNTEYPTPYCDVNLKAMFNLRDKFGVKVGYSDHTRGLEIPIAAVALGATVIEKHFTLDRTLPGPDHIASLEPEELKQMVVSVRHIEQALGDGAKRVSESERKNIAIARKSIVASRLIYAGEIFAEENLAVKRPGYGVNPMRWDEVMGTVAKRDFQEDELIEL